MSKRKPYGFSDPNKFSQPEKLGPKMWRSLEEKYADPAQLANEASAEARGGFLASLLKPSSLTKKTGNKVSEAEKKAAAVSRRQFLAGSSVAAAAAALPGCIRRPEEQILPFVKGPEYTVPGIANHFATVLSRGTDALGVLVTSHEGRPTKIEGNTEQQSSLGATDARTQIQLWDLYDPDRATSPSMSGKDARSAITWAEWDAQLADIAAHAEADAGAGLRFLSEPTNSLSFLRMRKTILRRYPKAKFFTYSSVNESNKNEGARIAFGAPRCVNFNLANAKTIIALDSDFLSDNVRMAREFASRRSPENANGVMSRLYAVEASHSVTGAAADHRFRLPATDVERYLICLAKSLAEQGVDVGAAASIFKPTDKEGISDTWLTPVAKELAANKGKSALVVGRNQPPRVHALALALNAALGNVGRTITIADAADPDEVDQVKDLAAFVAELKTAKTVFILGGNPVYGAPADIKLGEALSREGLTSVHLGTHVDETALACTHHVPQAHELETWGDQRSSLGQVSIQQPLIAPLWGARSAIETMAVLAGVPNWRGFNVVQSTLKMVWAPSIFDSSWRKSLQLGVAGAMTWRGPTDVDVAAVVGAFDKRTPAALGDGNFEVNFVPSASLFDGRHANNLWAQELPDPMTKLVWDNAALMSRTTRKRLGLRNGDVVKLSKDGAGSIEIPVFQMPGHADDSLTIALGWGRKEAGRYGSAGERPRLDPFDEPLVVGGVDVSPIRTSNGFYFTTGIKLEKTGKTYNLVQTQQHANMEGRPIAIDATMDEWKQETADGKPDFASYRSFELTTGPLWDEVDYSKRDVATNRPLHKWGMVIDLGSCTGCNACVAACQAENNIPAVGKQEVMRGRVMHWLRLDRYFVGTDDDPGVAMQPVGCQHCENAPCENVCPVNATAHSPEGLNDMAYNRCIGTRYCANNCPYKVRRFNYLDWHTHLDDRYAMHGNVMPETRKMAMNPNVTVRMRGIMEKCTYCVQRIQAVKIQKRREGGEHLMKDGDVKSACQQVCPSQAITFGDLNDESSKVAKLAKQDRIYKLLGPIGTRPRTTFLAKIRNPNPEIGSPTSPTGTSKGDDAKKEAH